MEPDGKVIIIGNEVIVADADPTVPSSVRLILLCTELLATQSF